MPSFATMIDQAFDPSVAALQRPAIRGHRLAAMKRLRVPAAISVCMALASCAGPAQVSDPLSDLRNPKLSAPVREKAIRQSWEQAQAGTLDKTAVREDLKTVAWSRHWLLPHRLAALKALLSDTDPKGAADTRDMVRLMLPREQEPAVTALLAQTVADRGWAEAVPSLVRSLSQPLNGVPDRERPEAAAIAKLRPGEPLERIVYQVFLNPPEEGGAFGLVSADRVRADAWNLLARLDSSGAIRTSLLNEDEAKSGPVDDIRVGLRELHVIPVTGEELQWLFSLRSGKSDEHRQWWDETSRAVATLDAKKVGVLQMRNLEAIRWAAVYRTDWLAAERQQLLSELKRRLDGRKFYRRSSNNSERRRPSPEGLKDWQDKLSWGDVLTILVADEGLKQKDLLTSIFAQVEMDRADETSEYGGLFRTGLESDHSTGPAFSALLFPPRPGARKGDNEFIASSDMLAQGDHALAHYHFHVQETRNGQFAGPSSNDLLYAARYGRMCMVFTSVTSRALDVDLYTPDGAVLDLGEVVKP